MKDLNKSETVATLAAVRAVLDSAPSQLANDALKIAEKKLDSNLEELNERIIDGNTR